MELCVVKVIAAEFVAQLFLGSLIVLTTEEFGGGGGGLKHLISFVDGPNQNVTKFARGT